ncbi:hypothetical protein LTR49_027344 [Elasticomyces elasticus]|nr:hypothetical protein LTR49_027344 [Elasticomyces elasticus]
MFGDTPYAGTKTPGRRFLAFSSRRPSPANTASAAGSLLLIITFLIAASQHTITKLTAPFNASGICTGASSLDAYPPTADFIRARTSLVSPENATLIREQHAGFLRDMPSYPKKIFKGRGVMMLAGGRYSKYAVTALGVLRESGSKLPVEVWRRDEREEKHGWCDEMKKEGMACRRLSDYLDTDILAIADGKEMKVFTMLFSSFEEVFFIDADNMALQPPEKIFESKHYQNTGVVLWHDYWLYDSINWLDYVVGLSGNRPQALWRQRTYESGQIALNKRKQ